MVKNRLRIQTLEEKERLYRSFFEEDLSGAFISKPDSRLVICNPEFARILGFKSVEEAVGYNLDQLYPESFSRSDFLALLSKERRLERFESTLIRIDGVLIDVIENAIGVFKDDGSLVEIRGYIMDVTEQKNLEKQLRQSHKMESIGTLAGGIAHDFNNILYHILGYAEMIMEDVPEGSPIKENAGEILNSARRAKALVDQILTFSRKSEPDKKPVEFGPVLEEAVKLVRSMLPTSIDIRIVREERQGSVKADPLQMHQVIMNLSTNAYHAMRETGGLLEIRVGNVTVGVHDVPPHPEMAPGEYLTVSVRDTGPGVPEEHLNRIFDPYFTTKSKDQGTGMGLSVVHGIIKSHNGHIMVSSDFGKGAVFDIYLPFLEEVVAPPEPPKAERNLNGDEHILVVDDEEPVVKMVSLALKRHGYRVTARSSSIEALETFKKNPYVYHLVLTDMTMPGMTGDKLAEKIKAVRSDTPVIISTGYSDMIDEERAEKMGVQALIMKPVSKNRLISVIRNTLDQNPSEKLASEMKSPFKVLVIDDDKAGRTIFTFYLKRFTNFIDVAETGEEGVLLHKKNVYDFIFTDIEMPGLNGFETTKAIRAWESDRQGPSVSIIGLSGHNMNEIKNRIEASGMDGYLQKPFRNGDFAAIFSRFLSHREGQSDFRGLSFADKNGKPPENSIAPPEFQGIDINKGLAKVHGRMDAYKSVLKLFKQDFQSAFEEIESGLNSGNVESAKRLAHTLKGSAGNIGAEKLFLAAKTVESEIAKGASPAEDLLEKFRRELHDAINSIDVILHKPSGTAPPETGSPPASTGDNPYDLEPLIQELGELIDHHNMKAEKKAVELRKKTDSKEVQDAVDTLIDHLERFRFKEAKSILSAIGRIVRKPR